MTVAPDLVRRFRDANPVLPDQQLPEFLTEARPSLAEIMELEPRRHSFLIDSTHDYRYLFTAQGRGRALRRGSSASGRGVGRGRSAVAGRFE